MLRAHDRQENAMQAVAREKKKNDGKLEQTVDLQQRGAVFQVKQKSQNKLSHCQCQRNTHFPDPLGNCLNERIGLHDISLHNHEQVGFYSQIDRRRSRRIDVQIKAMEIVETDRSLLRMQCAG